MTAILVEQRSENRHIEKCSCCLRRRRKYWSDGFRTGMTEGFLQEGDMC
jgi:hypothetical protein